MMDWKKFVTEDGLCEKKNIDKKLLRELEDGFWEGVFDAEKKTHKRE